MIKFFGHAARHLANRALRFRTSAGFSPWYRDRWESLEGVTVPDMAGARQLRLSQGNVVVFGAGNRNWALPRIQFDVGAYNNVVVLGRNATRPKLLYFQGSNNVCVIGSDILWPLDITVRFSSSNGSLVWGRGATSNGTSIILEGDGRSIIVGDDSMFAAGSGIRNSDLHAIFASETGALLNPSADVRVGARVWVGLDALIGKGVTIGNDAIVGAKALVAKDVAAASLVGGVPAKLLRSGVRWSRDRPAGVY